MFTDAIIILFSYRTAMSSHPAVAAHMQFYGAMFIHMAEEDEKRENLHVNGNRLVQYRRLEWH